MMHILSPDEYIIHCVNNYPALYASPSYEESKFRILDQTFNVIGNGICLENFYGSTPTQEEVESAKKWFSCSSAAYGYTKTKRIGEEPDCLVFPEGNYIVVTTEEMDLHPEIVHWTEFSTVRKQDPYPNFSKTYSLVWGKGGGFFEDLGPEWYEAAIWFYTKCREYFNDPDRVFSYQEAFPGGALGKDTGRVVHAYIDNLKRYETNEAISEAYGCEFVGDHTNEHDVYEFVSKRWIVRKEQILAFIEETFQLLSQKITDALNTP